MTEVSDTPHKATGDTPAEAIERIVAFAPMSEPALKALFDMGREGLKFATTGMQRCVEMQRAMLACRTFEDFQKVQADFYSGAMEDYRVQMARMMAPLATPSPAADTEGFVGKIKPMKRRYDDVPI